MSNTMYLLGIKKTWNEEIDYLADTIKAALVDSAYIPDFAVHEFFDDISNEIAGGGYTAGGETLAGKTVTIDAPTLRTIFDANNITAWDGDSFLGAAAVIIYMDTGAAATSPLIAYIAISPEQDAPLNLNFNANGIFSIGAC